MSIFSLFARKGPTGFSYSTTTAQVTRGLDLKGKTVLVTGCNSGLGYEVLRELTMCGAKVVGTSRTLEKASGAGAGVGLACDLGDPASVTACVKRMHELGLSFDAIIANAGIMALPKLKQIHGYEAQFFTNHVGHFALVTGILDLLKEDGRVVILSSMAHTMAPKEGIEFDNLSGERNYSGWKTYGQSKLANLLFAKELSRRFAGTRKTAYAIHPGVIATKLGRHMNPLANLLFAAVGPLFLKTIPQGAATELFAAVHPKALEWAGNYLADVNPAKNSPQGDDPALAKRLWDETEAIVKKLF